MIISTQIVTVWVLTLFMAYLGGKDEESVLSEDESTTP